MWWAAFLGEVRLHKRFDKRVLVYIVVRTNFLRHGQVDDPLSLVPTMETRS